VANRIDACFARLRSERRKAFIPYICAGDPSLSKTVDISLALEKAGSDILELGLPFSDPLADGIVNQLAAQRALAAGATARGVLDCVREIRKRSEIPIVLYTYMNPIFQFGVERFHVEAEGAGVDGLLILDLPPEEDIDQSSSNLIHVRLIAPTTPAARIVQIAKGARGFLYYVSREGVTGAREMGDGAIAWRDEPPFQRIDANAVAEHANTRHGHRLSRNVSDRGHKYFRRPRHDAAI